MLERKINIFFTLNIQSILLAKEGFVINLNKWLISLYYWLYFTQVQALLHLNVGSILSKYRLCSYYVILALFYMRLHYT